MTNTNKIKVLMGLYYLIDFDGRAQRAIDTFDTDVFDLSLLCWDSKQDYQIDNVDITRIDKESVNKFIFYVYFGIKLVLKAISLKPKIIYVHDYYLLPWGSIAKLFTGAKLVYDAHELLVPDDSRVPPRREKFYYNLEKRTIKNADLVISANEKKSRDNEVSFQSVKYA